METAGWWRNLRDVRLKQCELCLPEALAWIAFDPRRNHLLRVVARIVPGLDLRTNWSYATYRGYVASPWVPIPASALDGWHAP